MIEYVAGFLFDNRLNEVVLIQKSHPAWQAGNLNGVGGQIEEAETPLQAMIREFKEEAGVEFQDWIHFITLQGSDWKVYFFKGISNRALLQAHTTSDERIVKAKTMDLPNNVLWNLRWIIPLAMDRPTYDLKDPKGGPPTLGLDIH